MNSIKDADAEYALVPNVDLRTKGRVKSLHPINIVGYNNALLPLILLLAHIFFKYNAH